MILRVRSTDQSKSTSCVTKVDFMTLDMFLDISFSHHVSSLTLYTLSVRENFLEKAIFSVIYYLTELSLPIFFYKQGFVVKFCDSFTIMDGHKSLDSNLLALFLSPF